MTDRSRQAIVTFDREIREDDFDEGVRPVLMSIKGVASVDQLGPDVDRQVGELAYFRVKADMREKLFDFLFGEEGMLK